ncbi:MULTISPECIES: geranylgeranyl pyrophosphate synthase [Solibacillus]|uniref:Geranylgeranyl pyrophosphate synthase n=1 Tax=Solibacillus merdavium TaxID=2762218 RepID=A0ABR8XIT2_9BACL|nr:geranylgeranyl pyrophosphate synthase [Solibacillus merdavium]MBD8031837.1 geranylgeranyl pyrophosphate synthase [Solibacillus merdavium]
MNSQIQLMVPEWFVQDELHIIETIINKVSGTSGIVIAGENFDASKQYNPIVRLYTIGLVEDQYELIKELDSFQFKTVEDAKLFCSKLPELNAIDLIMLMNKEEPVLSV